MTVVWAHDNSTIHLFPPLFHGLSLKLVGKKFGDSDEQESVVCPAYIQVSVSLFFLFFFFQYIFFFSSIWSIKQYSNEKQSAKEEKKINLTVQFVSLSLCLTHSTLPFSLSRWDCTKNE